LEIIEVGRKTRRRSRERDRTKGRIVMRRLGTISGRPIVIVLLAVCALLGSARNSSACFWSFDIGPYYLTLGYPYNTMPVWWGGSDPPAVGNGGAIISIENPRFTTSPCAYMLGGREDWVTVVPTTYYGFGYVGYGNVFPLAGTLPPYYGVYGFELRVGLRANPRCTERIGSVFGARNWLGPYPTPTQTIVTYIQAGRPRVLQPDGTMKCEPDTTLDNYRIRTKEYGMDVRG
jgi:hypothetical protein